MTIPCPGPGTISFLDLQSTFENPNSTVYPIALNQFYRGGSYVNDNSANQNIPTGPAQSGNPISMNNFFCSAGYYVIVISANTTNYDVYNAFVSAYGASAWTSGAPKFLVINSGVIVGSSLVDNTSVIPDYALYVNTTNTLGGSLIIDNYGSIQGAGGKIFSNFVLFNRYYNGSTHSYGTSNPGGGYNIQAPNYFGAYPTQVTGTIELYKATQPYNGATVLTTSSSEYNSLTSTIYSAIYSATPTPTQIIPHPPVKTIVTAGYIPNHVTQVYVNGTLIPSTGYTATDGINVVLNTPAQPDITGNITVDVYRTPWTKNGIVGYVYSSSSPYTSVPVYRSNNGNGPWSTSPDYLYSTSSTEGTSAGYTSQGIAFYAPTNTGNGGNAIYTNVPVSINNQGSIYGGGGGGGSNSNTPFSYTFFVPGQSGGLNVTFSGTVSGLGGVGQGYNQTNTAGSIVVSSSISASGSVVNQNPIYYYIANNTTVSQILFGIGNSYVDVGNNSTIVNFSVNNGNNQISVGNGSNIQNLNVPTSYNTVNIGKNSTFININISGSYNTFNIGSNASGSINISGSYNTVKIGSNSTVSINNTGSYNSIINNQPEQNIVTNYTNTYVYVPVTNSTYSVPNVNIGGNGGTYGNPGTGTGAGAAGYYLYNPNGGSSNTTWINQGTVAGQIGA